MTALPDDIAKFTTDGTLIEAAYTAVKDLYPDAQDIAAGDEIEMFFDDPADGFEMLLERAAILTMMDRMHEAVEFEESYGLGTGIDLLPAVPQFNVTDASRGINGRAVARAIAFNMGSDRYAVELVGIPGHVIPDFGGYRSDTTLITADSDLFTADYVAFRGLRIDTTVVRIDTTTRSIDNIS